MNMYDDRILWTQYIHGYKENSYQSVEGLHQAATIIVPIDCNGFEHAVRTLRRLLDATFRDLDIGLDARMLVGRLFRRSGDCTQQAQVRRLCCARLM